MNNNINNQNEEERFLTFGDDLEWGIDGKNKSNEEIIKELSEKEKKLQESALDKYMIIGSVVGIEGNFKELMIIGYNSNNANGEISDYLACEYPMGATGKLYHFNHEDIKRVYFVGFTTEYGNEFKSNLNVDSKKKGMMM